LQNRCRSAFLELGFLTAADRLRAAAADPAVAPGAADRLAEQCGKPKTQFTYPHTFKVDPASPTGYTLLQGLEQDIVAPHTAEELVTS
jgi:hypothetical protein